MLSPAQAHRVRVESASDQQAASTESASIKKYRRLMLVRLDDDMARLSRTRSRTKRNELKRELIPRYIDYVTGAMMGNNQRSEPGQLPLPKSDAIMSAVCIWCFDVGDYSRGLSIFAHILTHRITSPEGFKRPMAEVIAESLAGDALRDRNLKSGDWLAPLENVLELTEKRDMADEARAKLYRAYATAQELAAPDVALIYYQKAQELLPRARTEKTINRLIKQQGKDNE